MFFRPASRLANGVLVVPMSRVLLPGVGSIWLAAATSSWAASEGSVAVSWPTSAATWLAIAWLRAVSASLLSLMPTPAVVADRTVSAARAVTAARRHRVVRSWSCSDAARNAPLAGAEVPAVIGGPVPGHCQAGSAEQAAGIAAMVLPVAGGVGEFTVDPQAGTVLAKPVVKPRPSGHQGLVGDLDGVRVGGDQAGEDQIRKHFVGGGGLFTVFGTGEFGEVSRRPSAVRGALSEGGPDSQQHTLQRILAGGIEPAEDALGGLGDGAIDPAGGQVPAHRQPSALAVGPCLLQRIAQQRQSAGPGSCPSR